jgi:hypothetical protein
MSRCIAKAMNLEMPNRYIVWDGVSILYYVDFSVFSFLPAFY